MRVAFIRRAPDVQRLVRAIQQINHYSLNACFENLLIHESHVFEVQNETKFEVLILAVLNFSSTGGVLHQHRRGQGSNRVQAFLVTE